MDGYRADYTLRSVALVRTIVSVYGILLAIVIVATGFRPYGAPLAGVDYAAIAAQYLTLGAVFGLTYSASWPKIHHPAGTISVVIIAVGTLIPYRSASEGIYITQFVASSSIAIFGVFALSRLPWSWAAAAGVVVTVVAAVFVYRIRPLPDGSAPWISWTFAFMLGLAVNRMGEGADQRLFEARAAVDRLLDSVYPKPVADRLRKGESSIADEIAEASVLMLDLANFTQYSAGRSAAEVVKDLNELFSLFDRLADEQGVVKIKTSGDLYMATTTGDAHAARMARFALALLAAPTTFELRIGLHCGSLVAGVVGQSRSLYDIWGDTVNTAARMEQTGERGRIQVSARFAECLGEGFPVEPRGAITIKGKGEMETFWLQRS